MNKLYSFACHNCELMAFCFVYTCAKLVYAFNRPLTFKARLSVKPLSVFSLNFSSAGKDHSQSVKEKICARGALSWGRGSSGVRDVAPPSLGQLGAKFFEMLFPHFKTYFMQISHCYLWTTIYFFCRTFDSNNFTLSSMFSFQMHGP